MKEALKEKLRTWDRITCPICGKLFEECWLDGELVIKKWCPNCKKFVYIAKIG